MIRVLVVDDSITVRKAIVERLSAGGIAVVGEAADGVEAVATTRRLRPDVVLMDIIMPRMDGLAATREIMTTTPTPVVVLSAYVSQKEACQTYDALAAGALEACVKPTGDGLENEHAWADILCTVRAAADVRVAKLRPAIKQEPAPGKSEGFLSKTTEAAKEYRIVVIGASTGGPVAIRDLLHALPADFPIPIAIALHCSTQLSTSVAGWLDVNCDLNVRDAVDNEPISRMPGTVLVAPPGHNLELRHGRTILHNVVGHHDCTPSVDVLFSSAAQTYGKATLGVLLTGMGRDGAQGLLEIRQGGGTTIAQDEASCAVFGMPAAAVEIGAVEQVVPLTNIPATLVALTGAACGTPDAVAGSQ